MKSASDILNPKPDNNYEMVQCDCLKSSPRTVYLRPSLDPAISVGRCAACEQPIYKDKGGKVWRKKPKLKDRETLA